MKNLILTFFTFLFLAVTALAAPVEITTTAELKPSAANKVAKGITIGFVKDVMDVEYDVGNSSNFVTQSGNQIAGIAFGYANINIGTIGYTTRAVINSYKGIGEESFSYRAEGNITYGFNSGLYLLGGFNYSAIDLSGQSNSNSRISSKPDFGFQIGGGYQMTENFGLQLIYAQLRNSTELNIDGFGTFAGDLLVSGAELSLIGTF